MDDTRWLGLQLLTGDHAPLGKIAVRGKGCVKERPCPFAPATLPPCPSSLVPVDVAEVHERFDVLSQQSEPLTVKGTLRTGRSGTAMACIPKGHCCNATSGWMSVANETGIRTLIITSVARAESGEANPTHFVSCGGDDSGMCCPLPLDTPLLARGWPFRLRLPGPHNLALAEVKLCRLTPPPTANAEPLSCEFDGLRYRDGATLTPGDLCVDCTCTQGTWQRQRRPTCLRLGSEPLSRAEKREVRKQVAVLDARGQLGPFVLVDDGLGEDSLDHLKDALVAAGALPTTIFIHQKGTSALPSSCQPEPTPGRELHFPP